MFVAIALDLGNEDSMKVVTGLLFRYGFKQMQQGLFESTGIDDKRLSRLKVDLDRSTDYYDSIRFYQYPVNDTVVITSLSEKRWRRVVVQEKNNDKE